MKDKEEMKNKNWEDKENSNNNVKAVISSSRHSKNKENNKIGMGSMKKSKNKEKYVYPELYNNTCIHKN